MLIIIGLGNPGLKYEETRHNVGFKVVDLFAREHGIAFDRSRHKALLGQGTVRGQKVLLVKPQTYMNLSGESVRAVLDFYKEDPADIVVIYDDISLAPGALRIRLKGSAGGHNGIKSILSHIGTDAFPRIKVGVGSQPPGWDLADFVMTTFNKEEKVLMEESIAYAVKAIEGILEEGAQAAMNRYNRKA
ncbi:aminoacyl-tRNA hydrolase [Anaerotalea alkaliphila]|uniref:Peptidyl-tRNA hydrolase n=1 Tax=Anaerotalea alkaliphila TaxID=2662126 RepID=A0A7X5HTH0_9FIRM|nr:aminoacyl-tRNA hydrolase [Anaerotalea alkaliphila]NDL66368.1 aminoacyl-tRNA hydrolase [Anaerotalea alkaliphila]